MPRQTIAATIRDTLFRIRADWAEPASPIEIEAHGHEWEETGETVADYHADDDIPSATALRAITATVQAHYDDWQSPDLSDWAILSAAKLEGADRPTQAKYLPRCDRCGKVVQTVEWVRWNENGTVDTDGGESPCGDGWCDECEGDHGHTWTPTTEDR